MIKKYRNWVLVFIVSIIALSALNFTTANAEEKQTSEDPLTETDVVITVVDSENKTPMDLEDLQNGIHDADKIRHHFGSHLEKLPGLKGVSFHYFKVDTRETLEKLRDSKASTRDNVEQILKEAGKEAGEDYFLKTTEETVENGEVKIENLSEGYYYFIENPKSTIHTSTAVPFALDLPYTQIDKRAHMKEIYVYPKHTIHDAIQNIENRVDNFNVAIGDLNTWTVSMAIPKGIKDYKTFGFVSEIDSQLVYIHNTVKPFIDGLVEGTDYKVVYDDSSNNVGQFGDLVEKNLSGVLAVHFEPEGLKKLAEHNHSEKVEFTFQTKVNSKAIMGLDIKNNAVLEYDNGHGAFSKPWSNQKKEGEEPYSELDKNPKPIISSDFPSAFVHTGGKVFNLKDSEGKGLPGAEFKIKKKDGEFLRIDEYGNVKFVDTEDEATTFTSDDEGKILTEKKRLEIKGLPYGDYTLKQTLAPAGYDLPNKLETPFVIDAFSYYKDPKDVTTHDQPSDFVDPDNSNEAVQPSPNVQHNPLMPETGGIGTLAFTLIGGLLMILSIVYYKKESKN